MPTSTGCEDAPNAKSLAEQWLQASATTDKARLAAQAAEQAVKDAERREESILDALTRLVGPQKVARLRDAVAEVARTKAALAIAEDVHRRADNEFQQALCAMGDDD